MAEQRQQFKTLTPQLVVGALPQRISATDLYVRGLLIEAGDGLIGKLFVAESENIITTSNRHVLYNPGDFISFESDPWGKLDSQINLKNIWIHGDTLLDKFVIGYLEITDKLV